MASDSVRGNNWPARIGLGGICSFLVLVVVLHFVESEFSPISRFVSEYALGDYGYLMNIAFFLLGVGTGSLALGLRRDVWSGHSEASALLGIAAAMVIIAGMFNSDPSTQEVPISTTGLVHEVAVLIGMIAVLGAAVVLAIRLGHDSSSQSSARVALVWAVVLAASMIVHLVTRETELAGMLQRIYVGVVLGWLVSAANLLRVSTEENNGGQS
jgi:hypothetical protein